MRYGASNTAEAVNSAFLFIFITCVALLALITCLMIAFVIKYHHSRHTQVVNVKGNAALEVIWTVIPTILVLIMFYYGVAGFRVMRVGPANAFQVHVTGRMWSWLFTYKNGIQSDTLKIPVDTTIKTVISSQDVLHSFFIPAFRIKQDAVPGRENHLYFKAYRVGSYDVMCAEFCGLRHAYMLSKVEVMPKQAFFDWYAKNKPKELPKVKPGASRTAQLAARGAQLVQLKGCTTCHSADGSKKVGPSFKGLYGSMVTVATRGKTRTVTADDAYLRRSILEPGADVVKGHLNIMPSQKGLLTDEEAESLIAHIAGLKGGKAEQ